MKLSIVGGNGYRLILNDEECQRLHYIVGGYGADLYRSELDVDLKEEPLDWLNRLKPSKRIKWLPLWWLNKKPAWLATSPYQIVETTTKYLPSGELFSQSSRHAWEAEIIFDRKQDAMAFKLAWA